MNPLSPISSRACACARIGRKTEPGHLNEAARPYPRTAASSVGNSTMLRTRLRLQANALIHDVGFHTVCLICATKWRAGLCLGYHPAMKEMADRVVEHYERHARDWDTLNHGMINHGTTALSPRCQKGKRPSST